MRRIVLPLILAAATACTPSTQRYVATSENKDPEACSVQGTMTYCDGNSFWDPRTRIHTSRSDERLVSFVYEADDNSKARYRIVEPLEYLAALNKFKREMGRSPFGTELRDDGGYNLLPRSDEIANSFEEKARELEGRVIQPRNLVK